MLLQKNKNKIVSCKAKMPKTRIKTGQLQEISIVTLFFGFRVHYRYLRHRRSRKR